MRVLFFIFLLTLFGTSPLTAITIELGENGDAQWTFLREILFKTQEDAMVFKEYVNNYYQEEDETFQKFKAEIKKLVDEISIDREMSVTEFKVSFKTDEDRGYIVYDFLWKNFAKLENNKIIVGDVFEGGYYLSEDEKLEIIFPKGYKIIYIEPKADILDDSKVSWKGKMNFGDKNPKIVLERMEPQVENKVNLTDKQYLYIGGLAGVILLLVIIILVMMKK